MVGQAIVPAPFAQVMRGTGRDLHVADTPITGVTVSAYRVPTDQPESDGTLEWNSTTLVLVHASAGGMTGMGYTYGSTAATLVIRDLLSELVLGRDALNPTAAWDGMRHAVRNIGLPGIAACAISAVDAALWDLAARLRELPLAELLGVRRPSVPVYGSGGFTSYDLGRLQHQLSTWAERGMRFVKMKVGRAPERDRARVAAARAAVGPGVELFIDANGAFDTRGALGLADSLAALDVTWFEEPVSSDDLKGLRFLRDHVAPTVAIAAGEYAWTPDDVRRMIEAEAVDVVQVDATRCCGITGFMLAASLCEAHHLPLSAHTAPALHLHACHAAPRVEHIEYFHDHVRIERLLFEGVVEPVGGELCFDAQRTGMGLSLRRADADEYRVA